MSRSLSLRLDNLERTFGSIPTPMSPEECDAFMERLFELPGMEIAPDSRERLMAYFRDVQSHARSIPFTPPKDLSDTENAQIRHHARVMENGSPELLEFLAGVFDRHAADVA